MNSFESLDQHKNMLIEELNEVEEPNAFKSNFLCMVTGYFVDDDG